MCNCILDYKKQPSVWAAIVAKDPKTYGPDGFKSLMNNQCSFVGVEDKSAAFNTSPNFLLVATATVLMVALAMRL